MMNKWRKYELDLILIGQIITGVTIIRYEALHTVGMNQVEYFLKSIIHSYNNIHWVVFFSDLVGFIEDLINS